MSSRIERESLTFSFSFDAGLLRFSFSRSPNEIHGVAIECRDLNGKHLGSFRLHDVGFGATQDFALEFQGLRARPSGALTTKADPFPELRRLHEALTAAIEAGVKVTSDLHDNVDTAICRITDALAPQLKQSDWEKMFSSTMIHPGILHLRGTSPLLSAYALMRFQEHYESPKFAGRIFSRKTFRSYYAGEKEHGGFSYYADWAGFNFRSDTVFSLQRNPRWNLEPAERAVLKALQKPGERFYVIGTYRDTQEIENLHHEACHGLYFVDGEYRRSVQAVLREVDLKPMKKFLRAMNYTNQVLDDECHAYLADGVDNLADSGVDLRSVGITDLRSYRVAERKLRKLFEQFFAEQKVRD
ncbi:MAG: hypothetical protein KDD64_02630 [Bdellovibrionales bacterium]|nr:hypothetical protein [Bdellovibrionales bacterium]